MLAQATRELHRRQARTSLERFSTFIKPDYRVNWHHRVMCRYLDAFSRGTIKRLLIFSPPRHGKSQLVSRHLPAYALGQDPDLNIIACSYNASLANQMNRDVQRVMETDEYQAVFPETRLFGRNVKTVARGSYLRNSDAFEIVGRRGIYYCAGVGGGITGRGFHRGIIDDPIKSRDEAESETMREKVWEWYLNDFYTRRMSDEAGICITLTRWHMGDLAGRLLQQAAENPKLPQWTVVRFPALCEEGDERHPDDPRQPGEALWPDLFSVKALEETRLSSSVYVWLSVYQQTPAARGGTIFTQSNFRYFRTERRPVTDDVGITRDVLFLILETIDPDGSRTVRQFPAHLCRWFQVVDTAMTVSETAAYTVVGTFVLTPDRDLLVYEIWRVQLEVPKQYAAIVGQRSKPPCRVILQAVENKGSGIGLIQQGIADGNPFRPLMPWGDKETRAATASQLYEAGKVWHHGGADWLPTYEAELTTFPASEHSDQVDVTAYAAQLTVEDAILSLPFSGDLSLWPDGTSAERRLRADDRIVDVAGRQIIFDDDEVAWYER